VPEEGAGAGFPELVAGQSNILVVNAKGGSGKTTLATNLAAAYARHGVEVALVDHDPQASATYWLACRDEARAPIIGVEAHRSGPAVTRTFLMRDAMHARRIVVDTPASLAPGQLGQWLREADRVIVPVLPSGIDIRAASRFIGALLLDSTMRARRVPLAVVANRVRRNTLVFEKLRRFLGSLRIPFVTTLRDTQNFVRGTETGDGIFDISMPQVAGDREALLALVRWLETPASRPGRPRR
jgi:chromosome partitioning protein